MSDFFSLIKSFALLVVFVLVAGFSAGIAWGLLERVFKFGLGMVS